MAEQTAPFDSESDLQHARVAAVLAAMPIDHIRQMVRELEEVLQNGLHEEMQNSL